MKDINWGEELLDSAKFNQKEGNLLGHGVTSLAQNWQLGSLYTRWKKLKGYKDPLMPNCQSSFLEWEKKLAYSEFYVLTEHDFIYPDW